MGDIEGENVEQERSSVPVRQYRLNAAGRNIPGELPRLNVPCFAWLYSQFATGVRRGGESELKIPLIVWWLETAPPNHKKRRTFFSDLSELGAPLRTNLAKTIRKDNYEYADQQFHIHPTNTSRYIYPVPKIRNTENNPGNEIVFAGKNLMNYYSTSYIPSYIAPDEQLTQQGLENAPNTNVLSQARGSEDEQWLYRNIVINTCQNEPAEATGPTCSTNSPNFPLVQFPELTQVADRLGWTIDVFMQYLYDNTLLNFGQYGNLMPELSKLELISAQALLLGSAPGDKNYRVTDNDTLAASGPNGRLVEIEGLRIPEYPPPWVVAT